LIIKKLLTYYVDYTTMHGMSDNEVNRISTKFFHKQLKRVRLYRGYKNQSMVVHGLGVSRQTYSLWEKGKRYPDLIKLVDIANFFRINMQFFFTASEYPRQYDLDYRSACGTPVVLSSEQNTQSVPSDAIKDSSQSSQ